ncbi:MAG: beta-glucosidase BglX [Tannerellaceae bacterium]|jgi:beta-glucosidase|nr:beta-glucosidase BglX [Tannerellaceae bacterium]
MQIMKKGGVVFCMCAAILLSACDKKTVSEKDSDAIDHKVEKLLSKMTLEEKIGQLDQITSAGNFDELAGRIKGYFVGSILNETNPQVINDLQRVAVEETRLGIPLIFARDVIHGFKTIFPVPLGQAASWNPETVEAGARVAAVEAASTGIRWTFAPMLDISRDARWGRIMESFGEDPHLSSILGIATVKGFQGSDLSDPTAILACAKHFVGYGAVESGKDYNITILSTEQLRNVYLRPFKAVVDAGVGTVMVSFNEVNGIPNSGNGYILRKVLRDDWGFDGVIVSDWNSIGEMINHGYAESPVHAAEIAMNAGVDIDMESHVYTPFLAQLLKEKKVKVSDIDDAVRRILKLKFKLGLFENPYVEIKEDPVFYAPEHLEIAKQAAIESAILLKNDGTLPLDVSSLNAVAVIGPMADAPHDQLGSWVFDGEKAHTVTPLTALREAFGEQVKIHYAAGLAYSRDTDRKGFTTALAVARSSDVILFFGGEESILSGEAHCRADITLPGAQKELLTEIAKTGKPVVLVVMAGRAIEIYKELPLVNAYLFNFHPGTMGGPAITDLLFGKAVPSGKLPISYPKMVGQSPLYYNHKNTGRPPVGELQTIDNIPLEAGQVSLGNTSYFLDAGKDPLFPFGFGLSYTTFEYNDLQLSSTELTADGSLTATCMVTNTGAVAAAETVQLYIRDKVGSVTRPVRELKDFHKIVLQPGESQPVSFTIAGRSLCFYNHEDVEILEPGDYSLWIAPHSAAGLEGEFRLQ